MLEMRGVTKRFGDVVALENVDFHVRAGEIHALLGENGAGKSTLMQLLSGFYRLETGEIRVDGRPVRIASPRDAAGAGIRMVYQHFTLVERFTVAENLALAMDDQRPTTNDQRSTAEAGGCQVEIGLPRRPACGVLDSSPVVGRWSLVVGRFDPRRAAAPALEMAARLGWRLDSDAQVGQLPVGVQQRVEIVKALQGDARLLIFDEPTAVLAPSEVAELFGVLRRLREEGRAIVFISHKLAEVIALCDRVTVLRRGRRVATLAVAETDTRALAGLMVGDGAAMAADGGVRDAAARPSDPSHELEGGLVLRELVVPGQGGRRAVNGVSMEVRRGEIFGLAGVDGNGQVELAEAIWGTRSVQSGTIAFPGRRPAHDASPPHRIGWIPQDRHRIGLILGMSVRDNLVLTLHSLPKYRRGPFLRRRRLRELADRLVARFDIRTGDPGRPVSTLSGGNQQKVVIARALFGEPEVLVAVNPTRGLDIGATAYVHQQLRQARDRGAAVLLISTELDEVLTLSDRVGVLYEGRLMGVVPPGAAREEIGLMMGGRQMTDDR
jgi:simple sugar transport system ATP-binding protein